MASAVSLRPTDSNNVRPNPCEETSFRNDSGPTHPLSCDFPERHMLETAQRRAWDLRRVWIRRTRRLDPPTAKPATLKRRLMTTE